MFLGQYNHTLDDKGRITIPSRFRDELRGEIVLTRGLDRCLVLYPMAVWEELAQKVNALPITDPRGRALRRVFFADAANMVPDRQGRILVPDRLRDYAGLDLNNEAVVVGLDRFLELWEPQRWNEENTRQMDILKETPALWENLQI
jgi:MraZ protein